MVTAKTRNRIRVNYMISHPLLKELEELIPRGERSDFINEAIEEALTRFSRKKAGEEMDKLRKALHLKLGNDKQLLKEIHYGRKDW